MKMRMVGFVVLAAGMCLAVSAIAAEKGKKGPDKGAEFAAADANSDGVLSLDEFKAMQAKREEALKAKLGDKYDAAKAKPAEEKFKKLDADGNGSLTKEELAGGPKKPAHGKGAPAPAADAPAAPAAPAAAE
jgi:Ca2+-binding EF-hand superfamily protein